MPGPTMKQRDLLLLVIDFCGSSPEFGRTSMQKVAYFVSEGLHKDFGHHAHFYGPFSEEVEDEIDALVQSGLVEEQTESLSFVGKSGFPGRRYSYSLTKDGSERSDALRKAYPDETSDLKAFLEALKSAAGGYEQGILSPAAKTYYLAKREKKALTIGEIKALGKELGWELSSAQVSRVVGVLKALNLVETK